MAKNHNIDWSLKFHTVNQINTDRVFGPSKTASNEGLNLLLLKTVRTSASDNF